MTIKFTFKSKEYGEWSFKFKTPKPLRVAKLQKAQDGMFYDILEEYVQKHIISPDFENAWEFIQDLEEDEEVHELSDFLRLMLGEDLRKKSKKPLKNLAT